MDYRVEKDSLGEQRLPDDTYYGVQTHRAIENFPITGVPISRFPSLIRALSCIKEAAATANEELGLLDKTIAGAIVQAAREVREGRFDAYFAVDVIQGGAGTSTNMNANEVIANRALEIMGHRRGAYAYCHPNDHVNLSQSTNDVYPTALKISAIWQIESLVETMGRLRDAFMAKGEEFRDILKIGRTQLQDAVPMTLGQEFKAYGVTIGEDMERISEASKLLHEINLGATAIGTGLNTVQGYAERVTRHLAELTGLPLVTSPDLVEATSDAGVFVQISGVLKRIAVKMSKICNDLRLLASGPRAGLGEIALPAVQAGSTIMPGKINPVIPEMVNQVCFQVIGNDVTITMAAEAGQLELNAFEPIIGLNLFESLQILDRALAILSERCIKGITANPGTCTKHLDCSIALVTALVPLIGYEEAAKIAADALQTGATVKSLCLRSGLMSEEELKSVLDPAKMTHPRSVPKAGR
jgi:aspartate ammonia-lyase